MTVEVCAGSIADCQIAERAGADRIELNSALFLGGLTPSVGTLQKVLESGVSLPIVCMVRPRGAGFCYKKEEFESMLIDAKLLLEAGAKGLAFGFLLEDRTIDWNRTKQMIELCQKYHAESVSIRRLTCAECGECHRGLNQTWMHAHFNRGTTGAN